MPGLHRIQVVDRMKMAVKMLNRKELEVHRSELFWSLYQVHIHHFFRLPCPCRVQQLFNSVNVLISKFCTGLTDRRTKPIA